MPKLILKRQKFVTGQPVLGSFLMEDAPPLLRHLFIRTIELPWKDNAKGKSCIPEGEYRMRYTMSNRFKTMLWEVMKVPGRSGIRIHAGNYAGDRISDSEGCILPCMKWADINGDGVIDGAQSRQAMQILECELRQFEGTGIDLSVRNG